MPTDPAVCSDRVLSVVDTCQVVGSVAPGFHALARTVVGFAPVTCIRIRTPVFAATVSPGTVTDLRSVPAAIRVTVTAPVDETTTTPAYSPEPEWRAATPR